MNEEFVEMVASMRAAQKAYIEIAVDLDNPNRPHLMRLRLADAKAWELHVDRWLEQNRKERDYLANWKSGATIQTDLFYTTKKTDEEPGAYNVTDEEAKAKGGAA